jgi:tripartite-type tricarboxylate transporter receptor subunit TctC
MVAFAEVAGVQLVHVPSRSSGARTPLLRSHGIKAAMSGTLAMLPVVKEKRPYARAISPSKRITQLPDVPTVSERCPGFERCSGTA